MRTRGFTLIEILVVTAVLSLLAGLLLPAVQAARVAARESQCRHNLHEIGVFIAQYTNGNGKMPALTTNIALSHICQDVRELVDADWKAIYKQRYHGYTRDFAMNDTGMPSVAIPIVYDCRDVHNEAVIALFLDGHVDRHVEPPKPLPPVGYDEDGEEG